MGRLIALTLLLVFSSELTLPLLLGAAVSNPEEQLPACCRRDGKHGCSMNRPRKDRPTVRGVCSEFRVRKATPATLPSAAVAVSAVTMASLEPSAERMSSYATPLRSSTLPRTHAGRGPPSA
ncbi:MAG: hypothetical protein JNK87_19095 [Bryobacterales bacterium]|nr:hypothetical protein [Bryobacterales bacterium]